MIVFSSMESKAENKFYKYLSSQMLGGSQVPWWMVALT